MVHSNRQRNQKEEVQHLGITSTSTINFKSASYKMEKSSASSVPKCRVCDDRHFLTSCPKFLRMPVVKRREVVKEKGFCFNCLCTAHTRHWCPSRKTCMVCQNHHHTLIHMDAAAKRTVHNNRPQTPSRSKSVDQRRPSSSTQRKKSCVDERLSRRTKTHVFLPTALARCLTPRGPEKTRVLLNSGGIQTIIVRGLVERLHLNTTRKDGKEYCTLNLQSYQDPTAKIQVSGVVKPQLNMMLPTTVSDEKLKKTYDQITDLADPHFFAPKNIEVVIANDLLPKILKAGMIQTSSTMPIAQSTIFGWTISGPCQY
ncbi:uncharacterized protein LOC131995086 [Stomoxys calcitrans]|uniref:uncharacterized protein LOC131995086 n=1 Tax=Stomoxys calcitrans TaxID=35570 RepID=UPI0027E3816B|nr:uncharacterized protein LOC131995086 [Stomoxys calcitrans]